MRSDTEAEMELRGIDVEVSLGSQMATEWRPKDGYKNVGRSTMRFHSNSRGPYIRLAQELL